MTGLWQHDHLWEVVYTHVYSHDGVSNGDTLYSSISLLVLSSIFPILLQVTCCLASSESF